jgi:hypothetical protein
MLSIILMAAFAALVIFIGVQHMDVHNDKGEVIEEAPMMTSLTVFKAASEGVGIAAGATAAVTVKAVSADKDRRAAGAESLAKSTKFQNFGVSSAYNRTYNTVTHKVDSFIYNKPEDHGINAS